MLNLSEIMLVLSKMCSLQLRLQFATALCGEYFKKYANEDHITN